MMVSPSFYLALPHHVSSYHDPQALPDLTDEEIANLFSALDLNHTGTVDVKEFFASLLLTMDPENQMAVARRSFRNLDRHHSGYLSKKVFMDEMVRLAVIAGMAQEDAAGLEHELEAEFRSIDANADGQISFEEFQSILGLMGKDKPTAILDEAKAKFEDMFRKHSLTLGAGSSPASAATAAPAPARSALSPLPATDRPEAILSIDVQKPEDSPEAALVASLANPASGGNRDGRAPSKSPTESSLVLLALSIRERSQSRTLQGGDGTSAAADDDQTQSSNKNADDSADNRVRSANGVPTSTSRTTSAASARSPDPHPMLSSSPSLPRGTSGRCSMGGSRTVSGGAIAAASMAAAVAATVASQPASMDGAQRGHDPVYDLDRFVLEDGRAAESSARSVVKDEPGVRFRENPIASSGAPSTSQQEAALAGLRPPSDAHNSSDSVQRGILKVSASMTRLSSLTRGGGSGTLLTGLTSSCTSGDQAQQSLSPVICPSPPPRGVPSHQHGRDSIGLRSSSGLKANADGSSTVSDRRSSPTDPAADTPDIPGHIPRG